MRMLFIACIALLATSAQAGSPWYAGAGMGVTTFEIGNNLYTSPAVPKMDNQELGFKVFGGYELNNNWALELGYIDFGDAKTYSSDPSQSDAYLDYAFSGIYVNGQYHIPIAERLSLDAAIGWLFAEATADVGTDSQGTIASFSYDDSGLNIGLALTWRTTDFLYLRATAEGYAIDFDKTIRNPLRLGLDLIWDF